jgi:actin-related protein
MIGLALDIGTATSKIGFIGESCPRLVTESYLMSSDSQRSVVHSE